MRRLTALLLVAGIIGLVALSRPHAQLSRHASISAPQHHVELPAVLIAPRVEISTSQPIAFAATPPLRDSLRTRAIYLSHRSLLL